MTRFTVPKSNEANASNQAPSLHIDSRSDGVVIQVFLPRLLVQFAGMLLMRLIVEGRKTAEAVNDNIHREAVQEEVRQDRERRLVMRRKVLRGVDRINHLARHVDPSPEELAAFVDEQALKVGVSRTTLVGMCPVRKRQVWRRYQDKRRALAYSMAGRGASGAEIGKRLGIGARAANKLVRTEIERRNQMHREGV